MGQLINCFHAKEKQRLRIRNLYMIIGGKFGIEVLGWCSYIEREGYQVGL